MCSSYDHADDRILERAAKAAAEGVVSEVEQKGLIFNIEGAIEVAPGHFYYPRRGSSREQALAEFDNILTAWVGADPDEERLAAEIEAEIHGSGLCLPASTNP